MRQVADLSKRLDETNVVMYATTKEMFFYGHPFRGAAMVSAVAPLLFADELPNTLGSAVVSTYVFAYWYFFLRKLTRTVWFDPAKDLYSVHIPYKQRMPLTFKAGHVTEIDDLFANLNIRGTKVFCPRGLFKKPEDYDKMLASGEKRRKNDF